MSRGGCVICVTVLGALFMSGFLAPQLGPFFSVSFVGIVRQQFVNFCGFEVHGSMGAAGDSIHC